MSDDLFGDAASRRLESRGPLAARLRPRTLDEVVGQVKQGSDKPSTRAEGRMQERKGEAQQLKGKVKDNIKDQVDKT